MLTEFVERKQVWADKTTEVGLLNLYDRTLIWRPAVEIYKLLELGSFIEWNAITIEN